jgi:hypothetical protein
MISNAAVLQSLLGGQDFVRANSEKTYGIPNQSRARLGE